MRSPNGQCAIDDHVRTNAPAGCSGVKSADDCPFLIRSADGSPNTCSMKTEASSKVEEVYDWWKHAWPIARVGGPVLMALFITLYSSGLLQLPFAKQSQVSDLAAVQKAQGEAISGMRGGITEIQSSVGKIVEKIGDLSGDLREVKTEVHLSYKFPVDRSGEAPAQAPAPAAPAPSRPYKATKKSSSSAPSAGIFGR